MTNENGPSDLPRVLGERYFEEYNRAFNYGMSVLRAPAGDPGEKVTFIYDYAEWKRLGRVAANEVLLQYGESHSDQNVYDAVRDVTGEISQEEVDKIYDFAKVHISNSIVVVSFKD